MRKYVQVVLVVLSVFSLVTLLVYRHEYNKLRYVLEVLNFFGTPNATLNSASCSAGQEIWTPPAWQRISNNIHIYSAYWDESVDRDVVKAIAVGTLTDSIKYGCYLWFGGEENPIRGEFNPAPIKNPFKSKISKNRGFLFTCGLRDMPASPMAVTFFKTGTFEIGQAYVPMTMVQSIGGNNEDLKSTVVCVMPSETKNPSKALFAEFISFHRSVDVQDFILYGGQRMWAGLSKEHAKNGRIQFLQWNYPYSSDGDVMRSVAQLDCELRTRGIWQNVLPLYPNQLIVPKFHSNIGSIFDSSNSISKFTIPVVIFCLEYQNDPKSTDEMPIVFQKTRYIQPRTNVSITVNRNDGSITRKISKDMAVVHWYTACDSFDDQVFGKVGPKFDHSILRFNTDSLISSMKKLKTLL